LRVAHRIVGTTKDHPLVRDLQLMIQSSRYITSRKEYERMVNASDPKAALDAFWLSCGNEKEASATLIARYYGRVEEANRYFSGVHPGWRTDRGMVHIVFGIPNKVRRGQDSEWWIYGEEGSANALVFRFLHIEHPWDSEFYALSRSIQFRSPWDRMVTNWRNGRIKAD
jgi:GWxTD domain-containing protein